jgi:four helix bundle protein
MLSLLLVLRFCLETIFYNTLGDFALCLLWDVIIIREPAKSFEDLLVWQKAHSFVLAVYRLTGTFPKHELFGLTSQFRRAAVSIPANIAEGFRRRGTSDKARFFNIAQASVEECRYYLILTRDLEYSDTQEANRLIQEVSKLLDAYLKNILAPDS